MPIPAQRKQQILIDAGIDPERYWIDDEGEVINMEKQGATESGVKSALYNAPRSALGFVGAALGTAGAGALGAPSGPGAIATGAAGGLAGAAAGATIGEKIQSALYPAGWRFAEEARSVNQPGAVYAGQLASNLVTMRPSPKMIGQLLSTAPKEFIKSAGQISPASRSALLNVAAGGALGGGVTMASGGDAGDVAREALVGALFHQPTKIGQKLSRDVFTPWTPDPTAAGSTGGMAEALQARAAAINKIRADAAAAQRAARQTAFDEAVARGEAPMPVEDVPEPTPYEASGVEGELGVAPSEDWNNWLASLAPKFKAKFGITDELILMPDGSLAAGEMRPRRTPAEMAEIGVSSSGFADTGGHEYLHLMIEDALNYGTPRERAFMEQAVKQLGLDVVESGGKRMLRGNLEELIGPREGGALRSEEEMVQMLGEDIVRRAVKPEQFDTTKQALQDFTDYYLRNRMTPEAARRLLTGRLMYGRGTAPSVEAAARRAGKTTGAPAPAATSMAEKVEKTEIAPELEAERARKAELDRAEAAQLKAENDAREARRVDMEAAFAAKEKDDARARMVANMENLPTSPKRVKLMEDMTQFADTGGEMPAGELPLPEPDQSYDLGNVRSVEEVTPGTEVARPETLTYTGESIPANIRRGREMRRTAAESPEDLELRRIEDKLSGRSRSKYQPFSTDFEKELAQARPFKLQVAKDGRMSGKDVLAAVDRLNPTEQEMIKSAGLDRFLRTVVRPNAAELKAWAEENVPRVEVKELSAEGPFSSEAENEMAVLAHELDTLKPGWADLLDTDGLPEHIATKIERYRELNKIRRADIAVYSNDSATRRYDSAGINPRELADMPGAVDLLVRLPRRKFTDATIKIGGKAATVDESALYSSNHYKQSGDNLLAHLRAYEHTMPNGEKVLRVFEVQSDWAQDRRKLESSWVVEQYPNSDKFGVRNTQHNIWRRVKGTNTEAKYATKAEADAARLQILEESDAIPEHPLLPHHQRLALKAAIEHARKRGIKKVVVDDAETAMLTEGHDRYPAAIAEPGDYTVKLSDHIKTLTDKITIPKSGLINDAIAHRKDGSTFVAKDRLRDDFLELLYDTIPHKIAPPQERGMRLAYDNVLQQMMRDLSGEGVKVELGEHRNALHVGSRDAVDRMPWQAENNIHGETRMFNSREEAQAFVNARRNPFDWNIVENPELQAIGKPRKDLIFKNPDGTPKTQSTGYAYDVSAAQARRDAGEPFSYAGRKYQPLGPDEGSYKGAKLPAREQPRRGIFAGNVEALRRSGNPDKQYFAERADELFARIRNYTGKYENEILKPLVDLSMADQKALVELLYDEDATGVPITPAARLRPAYKAIRAGLKLMATDQIAAGQLISGAPRGVNPTYFPNVVDPTVLHDLAYNTGSKRALELERQYIDYNTDRYMNKRGMSRADAAALARESFDAFRGALKPMSIEGGFDFGAVTMREGGKLPPTWVSADPVAGFRSYIKRFARSRAFYDTIQRDERAMAALGGKSYFDAAGREQPVTIAADNLARDPNARALMESAIGVTHESQEGITPAIGRLANSLLLSNVMTRVTDVATTPFKALSYLPVSEIPGLIGHLGNMRKSMENAYRTGGVRRGDMMVLRDVLGAGDRFVRGSDKLAEQIVKWTGSEALEKGARFLAQNVGEYVYDVNKTLAARGDKRALEFLNRLTPEWRTLDRAEVSQRVAQLFQGRYDATNLPIWIANSPAAPFFSMMKWNIEQWNNFKRFSWQPALNGDPMPLVKTLLGGALGGAIVGELREDISGKKQRVATMDELRFGFDKGDKSRAAVEAMRKAAFIAQVTGTLGIVGELGLQALDIGAKDKPQGFSWPAFEMAAGAVSKIQNAASAVVEKPDNAGQILANMANDLAKDNFSQYRILLNTLDRAGVDTGAAAGPGQVEESNRRRDLRMSNKLRGEKVQFSPFIEADYAGTKERRMDKTRDMAEARRLGMELKREARAGAKTQEEYESALGKLRASRIVGIPSKENNPAQYRAHIQFVLETQGEEAAARLRQTYARLRREQQIKAAPFK